MNPSRKGFSYEREIAKKLSLWITKEKSNDVLWRTEGSGGRFTNQKGKILTNSVGDIGVKDPSCEQAVSFINNVVIECKKGYSKDIDFLDLLDRKKGVPLLKKWLDKLHNEAILTYRNWCWIIFRRNNKHDVLLIYGGSGFLGNTFDTVVGNIDGYFVSMFRLDDFLLTYKCKEFMKS